MSPHHRHPHRTNKLLINAIIVFFFPYILLKVLIKLAINYVLLGAALMTPTDWNEEEEALLRQAIRLGYRPSDLIFTFWRREHEIAAKATELGLLTPETNRP